MSLPWMTSVLKLKFLTITSKEKHWKHVKILTKLRLLSKKTKIISVLLVSNRNKILTKPLRTSLCIASSVLCFSSFLLVFVNTSLLKDYISNKLI